LSQLLCNAGKQTIGESKTGNQAAFCILRYVPGTGANRLSGSRSRKRCANAGTPAGRAREDAVEQTAVARPVPTSARLPGINGDEAQVAL
jgi:hypothetical protein